MADGQLILGSSNSAYIGSPASESAQRETRKALALRMLMLQGMTTSTR